MASGPGPLTFYLLNVAASGSAHGSLQDGGTPPGVAATTTAWTQPAVATQYSPQVYAATQGAGTFGGGVLPTSPVGVADCWRSQNLYAGTFANAPWTFAFSVACAGGTKVNQGHLRIRVWRSSDPTGQTVITEITSATVVLSSFLGLSTTQTSATATLPAATLFNEYLFVQVACETDATGAPTDTIQQDGVHSLITTSFFTATVGTPARKGEPFGRPPFTVGPFTRFLAKQPAFPPKTQTFTFWGIPSAASMQGTSGGGVSAEIGMITAVLAPQGIDGAEAIGASKNTVSASPSGVPTAQSFGASKNTIVLKPQGIDGAQDVGAQKSATTAAPPGIPASGQVGASKNTITAAPAGIAPVAEVGASKTTTTFTVTGIPTAGQVGAERIAITLSPAGIPGAGQIGADKIAAGLSSSGIPGAGQIGTERFGAGGTLWGIPSAGELGQESITVVVSPGGIPSLGQLGDESITLAVGSLPGIPSAGQIGQGRLVPLPPPPPPPPPPAPIAAAIVTNVSASSYFDPWCAWRDKQEQRLRERQIEQQARELVDYAILPLEGEAPVTALSDGQIEYFVDAKAGLSARLTAPDGTRFFYGNLGRQVGQRRTVTRGETVAYVQQGAPSVLPGADERPALPEHAGAPEQAPAASYGVLPAAGRPRPAETPRGGKDEVFHSPGWLKMLYAGFLAASIVTVGVLLYRPSRPPRPPRQRPRTVQRTRPRPRSR